MTRNEILDRAVRNVWALSPGLRRDECDVYSDVYIATAEFCHDVRKEFARIEDAYLRYEVFRGRERGDEYEPRKEA